jgi:hypothetical protein
LGVGSILALNILETVRHKKSGSIQKFKKIGIKNIKGKNHQDWLKINAPHRSF